MRAADLYTETAEENDLLRLGGGGVCLLRICVTCRSSAPLLLDGLLLLLLLLLHLPHCFFMILVRRSSQPKLGLGGPQPNNPRNLCRLIESSFSKKKSLQ